MATPENTLITRAEVTSAATAATGRKTFTLDGSTFELGDTGLRDLSGTFAAGKVASGRVLVRRERNTVTWFFVGVTLAAGATTAETILANSDASLTPFAPPYTTNATVMSSATAQARLMANASGSIAVHYGAAGFAYSGSITYLTNKAWPTTLPGVADGQPVGV